MLQSWVIKSRRSFKVMTGKVNDFGFTNIRKTDKFSDLKAANKKADLCNYIWQKCSEVKNG